MLIKEKNFEVEKFDYLNEGWIESEISLLVKDKEKGKAYFDELSEKFENKKAIPLKIRFEEIEKEPFVGAIIIKFLAYDLAFLVKTILTYSPIAFVIDKEEIELPPYSLNEIFLDICDIFKTFKYNSKIDVYSKGTYIEGNEKNIEAIISLEFFNKNKENCLNDMNKAIEEFSKYTKVRNIKKDEILEDESEKEKIYFTNVELNVEANIFTLIDKITQFTPTSIEVLNSKSIKLNRDEIYLFLGKMLIISQKYTERIRQMIK